MSRNGFFFTIMLVVMLAGFHCSAEAQTVSVSELSPTQQQRAQDLYYELRCVVCKSQSIADSNAEMAAAMRQLVREKIAAGWSDEQIKNFLHQRYGDEIFFTPPFAVRTYALWFSPLLMLLVGILLIRKFLLNQPPQDSSS